MKVSHLSELLSHFGNGIASAGSHGVAKELSELAVALEPFGDRRMSDFIAFLAQCREYERSGAVAGSNDAESEAGSGIADPDRIAKVLSDLQELLDEARRKDVEQARIEQAVAALEPLSKTEIDEVTRQLEIQPKPRSKADAMERIRDTISMQAEISARVELSSEGF